MQAATQDAIPSCKSFHLYNLYTQFVHSTHTPSPHTEFVNARPVRAGKRHANALTWSEMLSQPGMSARALKMSYVSTLAPDSTSSWATRPPTFPQPSTRQVLPSSPPMSCAAPCVMDGAQARHSLATFHPHPVSMAFCDSVMEHFSGQAPGQCTQASGQCTQAHCQSRAHQLTAYFRSQDRATCHP